MAKKFSEKIIETAIRFSGFAIIAFVILIFLFLLKDALSLFRVYSFFEFFTERKWLPISEPPSFGIVSLIIGSFMVTVGAIVICVPIGVATALYIAEIAPSYLKTILKLI